MGVAGRGRRESSLTFGLALWRGRPRLGVLSMKLCAAMSIRHSHPAEAHGCCRMRAREFAPGYRARSGSAIVAPW